MSLPYTLNTKAARDHLDKKGFAPLSFFMGKEFVMPIISVRANKRGEWKEFNYCTFDKEEISSITLPVEKELTLEEFIEQIDKIPVK